MSQESITLLDSEPYTYTIEWRHILAAIPGDTNQQKLAWVQAQTLRLAQDAPCSCGGGCCGDNGADAAARAAVKALGKIEAVVEAYKARLREDSSMVYCVDDMNKIAAIVAGVE